MSQVKKRERVASLPPPFCYNQALNGLDNACPLGDLVRIGLLSQSRIQVLMSSRNTFTDTLSCICHLGILPPVKLTCKVNHYIKRHKQVHGKERVRGSTGKAGWGWCWRIGSESYKDKRTKEAAVWSMFIHKEHRKEDQMTNNGDLGTAAV